MATVRISPTEVQVDEVIYSYASAAQADAFEACVAAVDVAHCVTDHPPQATRKVDEGQADASA
jgi:hypothetical protein